MGEPIFSIRDATPDDLPAVVALWKSMMSDHNALDPRIRLAEGADEGYSAYVNYHLTNDESHVRVAITESPENSGASAGSGQTVAAFCLLAISRNLPMFLPARYGYLSDLVVEPSLRGKGIGRALVEDGADWLKRREIDTIQLQVYAKNEAAAGFWKALGFASYYDRMWLGLA